MHISFVQVPNFLKFVFTAMLLEKSISLNLQERASNIANWNEWFPTWWIKLWKIHFSLFNTYLININLALFLIIISLFYYNISKSKTYSLVIYRSLFCTFSSMLVNYDHKSIITYLKTLSTSAKFNFSDMHCLNIWN